MVSETVIKEIEAAVDAALRRKGVEGTVVLRDNVVELRSSGPTVAIDVGEWIDQWNLLPPDMRDRRADAAAIRLANAVERTVGPRTVPPRYSSRPPPQRRWTPVAAIVLAIGAVAFGAWWLISHNFFGTSRTLAETAKSAGPAAAPTDKPEVRTARVCEAARRRIYAGGSMAGLDFEGWEVVLWLARIETPGPLWTRIADGSTGVEPIAQAAKQAVPGIKLGRVTVAAAPPADSLDTARSVLLRFSGDYVGAFLELDRRGKLLDFVQRLALEHQADLAALYGKCVHLPVHDIGAWYWGRDAPAAAAALLYGAGLFVKPPAFADQRATEFKKDPSALVAACGKLDAKALNAALASFGGRTTEVEGLGAADAAKPPPGGLSIRFPLGGPTRAAAASRALAKQLSLAP